jgi:hypothetical protein
MEQVELSAAQTLLAKVEATRTVVEWAVANGKKKMDVDVDVLAEMFRQLSEADTTAQQYAADERTFKAFKELARELFERLDSDYGRGIRIGCWPNLAQLWHKARTLLEIKS